MKKLLLKFLKTAPFEYYQYLKTRVKRSRSGRLIRTYLKNSENPKLNIGSGRNVLQGWLNTDRYPPNTKTEEVVYLDASIRFPFEDDTFEFIYSEHIFEHLEFKDSCNMLAECYRVLKPGGTMRMAIPHIGFLQDLYHNPEAPVLKDYISYSMKDACPEVHAVLGENEHSNIFVINNFYRDWGHQVIHSYGSLRDLIGKFGFNPILQKEVGESEFPELTKLEGNGRGEYPREFYDVQTLVVEAKK